MSDLTIKSIFEEKIATDLIENPDKTAGMNVIYQFNITGDGGASYYVDLAADPPAVHAGTSDAPNCTINASDTDFIDIVSGKLNGQMAFMTGKLKIAGDMGLAMKLQKLIG